ncbi:hypothetical protein NFHSH190041_18190 [Shewanella sp. NFH-SH190041]|nr:hypothetical protein NFHSH190041_18190 [Shewanella sp. NFH-SH190041]
MIGKTKPLSSIVLYFLDLGKQMFANPAVSNCFVVSLDISLLIRGARLNIFNLDLMSLDPTYKLTAIECFGRCTRVDLVF